MNIPPDLVIISDLDISKLTEDEFSTIIYEKWYRVNNVRFGQCLAMSADKCPVNAQPLEDKGFSIHDEIKEIPSDEKKWNQFNFFV